MGIINKIIEYCGGNSSIKIDNNEDIKTAQSEQKDENSNDGKLLKSEITSTDITGLKDRTEKHETNEYRDRGIKTCTQNGDSDKMDNKVIANLKKIQSKCQDTSNIETEEATKHSLILPLINALGYDIFNNDEVRPEYIADVGTKRGEKVDYVIIQNGQPLILIEAKQVGTPLKNKIDQLFRYFVTTTAKIAILTDGVKYLFFTDSQKENIMDNTPYMSIDMRSANDRELSRLAEYHKNIIDVGKVVDNIKYDILNEAVKSFIDSLVELRPENWFIRKLAEDNNIGEADDAKLAQIVNSVVIDRIKIKKEDKHRRNSITKLNTNDMDKSNTNRAMMGAGIETINNDIFKDTKGMKIKSITVNGDRIIDYKLSWKSIYRYIFEKSTHGLDGDTIIGIFNKGGARKFIYKSDCNEDIKSKSYLLEEQSLYLYQHLSGKEIVCRIIDTCKLFGVFKEDNISIEYEIYR